MRNDSAIFLAPAPKRLDRVPGWYALSAGDAIRYEDGEWPTVQRAAERLVRLLEKELLLALPLSCKGFQSGTETESAGIRFVPDRSIRAQGYMLCVNGNGVTIRYGDGEGAYHAVSTLKQLLNRSSGGFPGVLIEDEPDFPVRGVMLDISRNKIPTMETLYRLIDLLSDFKINHLQLYIEGFSYAYPSFPQVWEGRTPMTGREMEELDRYCRERYIDFVPNQNSFGHMTAWTALEEFKPIAECPDGFDMPLGRFPSSMSLNPLSPDSLSFVERLYDDLLPHFTSPYFNVGCDETFDLGLGRSREECERLGKGRVYLNYLMEIYKLCKARGKTMMFWGDIIKEHAELVPELPRDVIAMEWGYGADQPSEAQCERYARSGIPFYVCPGTSSWNSITGLTDNMKSNIRNAAAYGAKHGARGLINTDWGDAGHWQPTPVSYTGFVYGAAMSWGAAQNEELDLGEALSRFVFRDAAGRMGRIAVDLGNYSNVERPSRFNGSGVFRTLYYHQYDDTNRTLDFMKLQPMEGWEFENVKEYVGRLLAELDEVELRCDDAELVLAEYRQACRLILLGAELGLIKLTGKEVVERRERLETLIAELEVNIGALKANWLARNRSGGLEDSMARLYSLKDQLQQAQGCTA
ncbi:beta-N-acetylhexosaminidase [Cohnella candidum]|uniref:beta-N-acetylhexosaminidase n=1 Tax=Cohnella candidum TaxID=2674991 RepID=A0A3G3JXG4_9BACL|nr:family 20 glycosylhydrolase [Cohnella candidum]AYQ72904.1 glycoside hydrolase [Cohnella candidum]